MIFKTTSQVNIMILLP